MQKMEIFSVCAYVFALVAVTSGQLIPVDCGKNQHYPPQGQCIMACDLSCENGVVKKPEICPQVCARSCLCNDGFVRVNKTCISKQECIGGSLELTPPPTLKPTPEKTGYCVYNENKYKVNQTFMNKDYCKCICKSPLKQPNGTCTKCLQPSCLSNETLVKVPQTCCGYKCVNNDALKNGICVSNSGCCNGDYCGHHRGQSKTDPKLCLGQTDGINKSRQQLLNEGGSCPGMKGVCQPYATFTNYSTLCPARCDENMTYVPPPLYCKGSQPGCACNKGYALLKNNTCVKITLCSKPVPTTTTISTSNTPAPFNCFTKDLQSNWSPAKKKYCCSVYKIACPSQCPDNASENFCVSPCDEYCDANISYVPERKCKAPCKQACKCNEGYINLRLNSTSPLKCIPYEKCKGAPKPTTTQPTTSSNTGSCYDCVDSKMVWILGQCSKECNVADVTCYTTTDACDRYTKMQKMKEICPTFDDCRTCAGHESGVCSWAKSNTTKNRCQVVEQGGWGWYAYIHNVSQCPASYDCNPQMNPGNWSEDKKTWCCANKNVCIGGSCPDNSKFNSCGSACEDTCNSSMVFVPKTNFCIEICKQTCECDDGYLKHYIPSNSTFKPYKCVKQSTCTYPLQYNCRSKEMWNDAKVKFCCSRYNIGCKNTTDPTTCFECVGQNRTWQNSVCNKDHACNRDAKGVCYKSRGDCELEQNEKEAQDTCPRLTDCSACASNDLNMCLWNNKTAQCVVGIHQSKLLIGNESKCYIGPHTAYCNASNGEKIEKGGSWQESDCITCMCSDPVKSPKGYCVTKDCAQPVCDGDEVPTKIPGKCCSVCRSTRDPVLVLVYAGALDGMVMEDQRKFKSGIKDRIQSLFSTVNIVYANIDLFSASIKALVTFLPGSGVSLDDIESMAATVKSQGFNVSINSAEVGDVTFPLLAVATTDTTGAPTSASPTALPTSGDFTFPPIANNRNPTLAPSTLAPSTSSTGSKTGSSTESSTAFTTIPNENKGGKTESSSTTLIIAVVVGGVILLAIVALVIVMMMKKSSGKDERLQHVNPMYESGVETDNVFLAPNFHNDQEV